MMKYNDSKVCGIRALAVTMVGLAMLSGTGLNGDNSCKATSIQVNGHDITKDAGSNSYNLTPHALNGRTGFAKYSKFDLSNGDVANFIFRAYSSTSAGKVAEYTDIDTFVAAVQSGKVNIDGIVNALSALPQGSTALANGGANAGGAGSFAPNSHLIFVAPGGVVVGASGVLNVGQLSVYTPNNIDAISQGFDISAAERAAEGNYHDYTTTSLTVNDIPKTISNSSHLENEGTIITSKGFTAAVGDYYNKSTGKIITGTGNTQAVSSTSDASALFTRLVNTGNSTNTDGIKITTQRDWQNDGVMRVQGQGSIVGESLGVDKYSDNHHLNGTMDAASIDFTAGDGDNLFVKPRK